MSEINVPSGQPQPVATGDKSLVIGMGACYALGTFTDNFYKQCAILLAASMQLTTLQSYATVLFSLPFILFSAYAGWTADIAPKRNIVITAKATELLALTGGGAALIFGHWWGILLVIFSMGLQSTFFSPAINGSIPENFPPHMVPRVNSLIKLASTIAILAGIAMAGVMLDLRPSSLPSLGMETGQEYGQLMASIFIVCISAAGLITAFTLHKKPAPAKTKNSFPLAGPLDSFRHILQTRNDPQLFLILLAEAFFYGLAAIAMINISNMSKQLGYSDTTTSIISTALMIGVAVGSLIAGKREASAWKRLLVPSCTGMGLFLILAGLSPMLPNMASSTGIPTINPQLAWLFATLMACGICGGLYLIPITSFIQIRPAAHEKGKILGASNFMSFVSIASFGVSFYLVGKLSPAIVFGVYGFTCVIFAAFMFNRVQTFGGNNIKDIAASPLALFLRLIFSVRYKVEESGLENIPAQNPTGKGTLFLPNHPALMDPLLVYSRIAGAKPRPLADENQVFGPLRKTLARALNTITIPDVRRSGRGSEVAARAALEKIATALENGENVLLYPSGRLYRSAKEELGANSAVYMLLQRVPEARVVLVRTKGLWGSSFSYANGHNPSFFRSFARGLLRLIPNLLFFMPKRRITMEFAVPEQLPLDLGKKELNSYLEEYYNQGMLPATKVPKFFWQGSTPLVLQEQKEGRVSHKAAKLTLEQREKVFSILREVASLEKDFAINEDMLLATDIGIDSLALMVVSSALEAEFGYQINSLEDLATVGDCLAASTGALSNPENAKPIPQKWFKTSPKIADELLSIPEKADTIVEAFLQAVKNSPTAPLLADRSGMRTRWQVLLGAFLFAKEFKKLPGKRLGIMLPATPASTVCWLGAVLAGKEPVMLNWTVGKSNMLHCLSTSETSHVVTAAALLDQLDRQGNDLSDLPVEFIHVEEMAAKFGKWDKIRTMAKVWMHICGLSLSLQNISSTAVILFTSGSEASPKAVPLTHKNLMTNAADLTLVLGMKYSERVLAMLPPFHSFGLMVGIVLPLSAGLPAAFHPNPTEAAPLVFLVRDYKLTLMGATPTFLEAILQRAKGTNHLDSLRFAFVGAEKCSDRVAELFSGICPSASLCEGYGITECSPVVSVNAPGAIKIGTIGHPLPSVHTAIVEEDTQTGLFKPCMQGNKGLLLVRGDSIFNGYLGDAKNPFVEYAGRQWYSTGDLVLAEADGRLVFQGRLKRFAKIGGEMISLPQMEEVIQRGLKQRYPDLEGLHTVVEVLENENTAPRIVAFTTLELAPLDINKILKDAGLSALYNVREVIKVESIPVLGTGKTDYRALKNLNLKNN